MPKATGKSINTPMKGSTIDTPHPGGDMGTDLDFATQPHENISGHNVYEAPEKGSYGGQGESKIVSPAKVVKRVDVKE